jgi:hypothetical protein
VHPAPSAAVASGNYGFALSAQGNYLYIATWDHPVVFDITDPSAPVFVKGFGEYGGHDTLILDNKLYIPYWDQRKLSVWDIVDPTNPQLLGEWTSGSYWGSGAVKYKGYLYFSTDYWGLEVLDVTDPAAMKEIGSQQTDGPDGMDTDGVYIYTAENENGLKIII